MASNSLRHNDRHRLPRGSTLAAIALTAAWLLATGSPALANGVPLNKGDVLVSIGNGLVKHFDPSGILLDTLNTTTGSFATSGMCTDTSSNLSASGSRIAPSSLRWL